MTRHGGEAVVLDATSDEGTRAAAFAAMDGLLISGGADLHPERYGQPSRGSLTMEPDRDALEHEAWIAAQERGLPVLGVCRGFQAINAFSGGTLLQHVDGHQGPRWGSGAAKIHPLRIAPGTRLARILFPTNAGGGVLRVNSYHHQAVRAVGPGTGARRQRLGEQPGRRPDRRAGGGRRSFRVRRPVPPRAHRIDAAGLRAAVQRLRRRRTGAGRPALGPRAGARHRSCAPPSRSGAWRRLGGAARPVQRALNDPGTTVPAGVDSREP